MSGKEAHADKGVSGLPDIHDSWYIRFQRVAKLYESIDWSSAEDGLFQEISRGLIEAFESDAVSINLFSTTGDNYVAYQFRDRSDAKTASDHLRMDVSTCRMPVMIETKRPIAVDFVNPHKDDVIHESAIRLGYKSAIAIPLLAGEEILGAYTLSYKESKHWEDCDIEYYCLIGRLIGMTIRCVLSKSRAAELQILDERRRLSAEIHDNLSQIIGSVKLGTDDALMSFGQEDNVALGRKLDRLNELGKEALVSLRFEMLSLRDSPNPAGDFVLSIKDCLARFEVFWRIETSLRLIGFSEPIVLPSNVELQFMRILHESLSNVIRHAAATSVSVTLQKHGDRLSMQVTDNGCGFDPEGVPSGRLGICIMKERVAAIGGRVTISSEKGKGTAVCVDASCPG